MSAIVITAMPAYTPRAAPLPPESMSAALLKVERILDVAFFPGRTERSPEYREGCRAALEFRLVGRRIHAPYAAGCAAADAFFAGVQEGHAVWRRQTGVAVQ